MRLIVMRHAKAEQAAPSDFARPLAKRYDGDFARFSPGAEPEDGSPSPARPLRYG